MFVSAAAMTALSVAASFPLILGLVLLAGASAEMYRPAAAALIGDLVEPGKRVTAFAVFRLAMNLGSAAGPATAGFLASHSFRYVFLGDALSSVVYGLVALLALPDLRRTAIRSGYARGAVRHALANRAFVTFIAATLCVTWIEYQVSSTFPLYVRSLGYSMTTYGYLLSLNGLLVVLFELSLTALTQRFQTQSVIAAGYALFGIGYAAVGLAHGTPMLVAAVVLWTCGEMVFAPVTGAYVTNLAPAEYRGRYSGMYVLTWSIGMLLGPSLGMLLFDRDSGMYFAAVAFAGVTGASLALVRPRAALASATQ
jgi:MFS family permease